MKRELLKASSSFITKTGVQLQDCENNEVVYRQCQCTQEQQQAASPRDDKTLAKLGFNFHLSPEMMMTRGLA